jgi:hypothetical protein
MKREDITLAAQLLTTMKETTVKLEQAIEVNDKDVMTMAKQHLLEVQAHLANIL